MEKVGKGFGEKKGGGWRKLVGAWRKDVVFGNTLHHSTHMRRKKKIEWFRKRYYVLLI